MFGFDVNKLKPHLKMAVHRIGIIKNKKKNVSKTIRREIANLLKEGKEEKARIKVEGVIRDDLTMEGYEIIELFCELIAERANLVKSERECPYDMREAICTLIWAANRTEIPELAEVKKQLTKKYGQDFTVSALKNVDGCVNEQVMEKLSVNPPSAYVVINYMKGIAKEFNVEWEPDEAFVVDPLAPMAAPTGSTITKAAVSGPDFAALYALMPPAIPSAPAQQIPTAPSTPSIASLPPAPTALPSSSSPASLTPGPPSVDASIPSTATATMTPPVPSNNDIPDFDELTARFERLRKRQNQGPSEYTF